MRRRHRRSWWAAPAALICASACAQILGSDGKLLTPAPAPDAGPPAACGNGELRCDGVALQILHRVALVAEKKNHHPDIHNSWSAVTLDLSSHDAGGVTQRDVDLAAAIDDLTD